MTFDVSVLTMLLVIFELITILILYYANKNWRHWDSIDKIYSIGIVVIVQLVLIPLQLAEWGVIRFV